MDRPRSTFRMEGLDLLLVHAEAGISPLDFDSFLPPLGVIELACYLNSHGFNCGVIDARHRDFSIDWFHDFLSEARPRFVGMSVLTDIVPAVRRLIGLVRRASPKTRIVVGGAHATVRAEEVLDELEADIVVLGEGEVPAAELLSKKNLNDVRGILFRDGERTVRTEPAPLIDMDELPSPDYRVVWGFEDLPYAPSVHTARGCPYRCSFCAAPLLGPKIRTRSIKRSMEDIELVVRLTGQRYVSISDDTFTLDGRRVRKFARAIESMGGGTDLFWYAEGRIDRLARDMASIKVMKRAGCRFLQLGIESGDERVLKAYRKEIRISDAIDVCSALAEEMMLVHAGFIVGGPFESPETFAHTVKLMERLAEQSKGLMQAKATFLNPLPGTDVYEHPDRYGIRLLDPDLYSSTGFDNAVTETERMCREEIFRQQRRTTMDVMARLREVFDEQGEELRSYLSDLYGRIGAVHIAFGFLSGISSNERANRFISAILTKAGEYAQFFNCGHDLALDLVPARLPAFGMRDDGRYDLNLIDLSGERLSDDESDVLHFSCGKLTGREIAFLLEMDEGRMKKALKGLEDKRAIVYRSY